MYRFVFLWPFSAISHQNIYSAFSSQTLFFQQWGGDACKKLPEPERSAAFHGITISLLLEGAAL
jgi:hypothetical protein